MLELGDRAEDLEEHPPHRGGGVDPLVEDHQVNSAGGQGVGQFDEMLQGATQPIQFGHHNLVTRPIRREQRPIQLGAARQLPRHHVQEDLIAADGREGIVLGVGMLVARRDPPITDLHEPECIANPRTSPDTTISKSSEA